MKNFIVSVVYKSKLEFELCRIDAQHPCFAFTIQTIYAATLYNKITFKFITYVVSG